jgi:hypothetical protein
MSLYARAGFADGNGNDIGLAFNNNGSWRVSANFDLDAGTYTKSSSGYAGMDYVGNGWYRCWAAGDALATDAMYSYVFPGQNSPTQFNADGVSNVEVWGLQVETGKFPTSYIPTSGSTVSRSPDYAKISNMLDFFDPTEGTFYVDQEVSYDYGTDTNTRYPLQVNGSAILVIYKNSNSSAINTYDGSSALSRTPTTPGRNKIVMGYSLSEARKSMSINGSTTSNTLNGLNWKDYEQDNEIVFGNENNNVAWVRKIAYYPKYLSDEQKSALTENN